MDWRMWAPFQSQTLKNVCNHMTKDEINSVGKYLAVTPAIVSTLFVALPLTFVMDFGSSRIVGLPGLALIAWLAVGFCVFTHRRKKGRDLLCATAWAKSQGIKPSRL